MKISINSAVFSISIILMLISTTYDVIVHAKPNPNPNKLLIAFSVYTNGKKLFDMTESTSTINSLHGLRAISIIWIMFGHRITNQTSFPLENQIAVLEFNHQLYSIILYSYSIAVDTFFLMGALLLCTSTLRAIDKNNLNIFRMIVHRYLRYTPVFAVCILCTISLSRFVVTGPLEVGDFRNNCVEYWWSSLLHIQNYVNPDTLCLNHTWFVVEYQLFHHRIIWKLQFFLGIYQLIFNFLSSHHFSFMGLRNAANSCGWYRLWLCCVQLTYFHCQWSSNCINCHASKMNLTLTNDGFIMRHMPGERKYYFVTKRKIQSII